MSINILQNHRERIHLSLLLFKCCFSVISSVDALRWLSSRETFVFHSKNRAKRRNKKENNIIIIIAACVLSSQIVYALFKAKLYFLCICCIVSLSVLRFYVKGWKRKFISVQNEQPTYNQHTTIHSNCSKASLKWPLSLLSIVLLLKSFDVTRNVSVRFKM